MVNKDRDFDIRDEIKKIEGEEEKIEKELDEVAKEERKIEKEIKQFEIDQTAFDIWIIFIILLTGILIIGIFGYYYNRTVITGIETRDQATVFKETDSIENPIKKLSIPLENTSESYCGPVLYYFYYPTCSFCDIGLEVANNLKKRFGDEVRIEKICGWSTSVCRTVDPNYTYDKVRPIIKRFGVRGYPTWIIGCKYRRNNPMHIYVERGILDKEEILRIEEAEISTILCYLENYTLQGCHLRVIYRRPKECTYCDTLDYLYESITTPMAEKSIVDDEEAKLIVPRAVVTYDSGFESAVERILHNNRGHFTFLIDDENYTFKIPGKPQVAYVYTETCPICEDRHLRKWLNDFMAMGGTVYRVNPANTTIPFAPAIYINAETFRAYTSYFNILNRRYGDFLRIDVLNTSDPNSDIIVAPPTVETGYADCGKPNTTMIFYFYRPGDPLSNASLEAFHMAMRRLKGYVAYRENCIGFTNAEKIACKTIVSYDDYVAGMILANNYNIVRTPAILYNCRYLRYGSFARAVSREAEANLITREVCRLLKEKPSVCSRD